MAAKKKTTKPASKKPVAKAAKLPTAKKAPKGAATKPTKKTPAKESAKKSAVKETVKKAVVKKEAKKKPIKKVAEKVTKKAPVEKAVEKAAPVKKAPKVPKKAIKKKVARKSSLISTPPPAAPKKPRFVPPPSQPIANSSSNGGGNHKVAFIRKQNQRLLDLRNTLADSMSGMTRDTIRNAPEGSEASGSGQHQGDAGSDAYDRDFALSILANEQDALYEVEQALRRVKIGSYGRCEISDVKIPIARLEAIPFARLTVDCQAQWEKEYGNRRFRPSDEVGFSGGAPQEDQNSVTVSLDGDDD